MISSGRGSGRGQCTKMQAEAKCPLVVHPSTSLGFARDRPQSTTPSRKNRRAGDTLSAGVLEFEHILIHFRLHFAQLAVKGVARNAKQSGGLATVTVGQTQGALDSHTLQLVQEQGLIHGTVGGG